MLSLDNLILTRLLAGRVGGETRAAVGKSLEMFFLHRLSRSAWNDLFSTRITQLNEARTIEPAGNRLRLTAEGQHRVLTFLGRETPPARLSWTTLKNADLIALALRLPLPRGMLRQRIASAGGLRAAILRRQYGLPIDVYPTLPQARDALLWRQLSSLRLAERLRERIGDKVAKPFAIKTLSMVLLNELLGSNQELAPGDALNQLVARAVNARRVDVAELRLAILRSALDALLNTEVEPAASPASNEDLVSFAQAVLQAARSCQTGWFGTNEVFIAHVWNQFQIQGKQFSMDEETFKRLLREANNRNLLTLSRADLVEAMDARDVATSEIRHLNAVYHFIRFES